MRHRKGGFKLQRDLAGRRSLLRGLATSIILEDRIVTTVAKAKAVRPVVDKMITLGKRDTLHSRRQAAAFLNTPGAVKKLFDTIAPRFSQREGGYTRIIRLGYRRGDGAEQAMVEIVGSELKKRAEERRKRREERLKRQQTEAEAQGEGGGEKPSDA